MSKEEEIEKYLKTLNDRFKDTNTTFDSYEFDGKVFIIPKEKKPIIIRFKVEE